MRAFKSDNKSFLVNHYIYIWQCAWQNKREKKNTNEQEIGIYCVSALQEKGILRTSNLMFTEEKKNILD